MRHKILHLFHFQIFDTSYFCVFSHFRILSETYDFLATGNKCVSCVMQKRTNYTHAFISRFTVYKQGFLVSNLKMRAPGKLLIISKLMKPRSFGIELTLVSANYKFMMGIDGENPVPFDDLIKCWSTIVIWHQNKL